MYQARTPEQLLHEIRSKGRDGGGLSVKQLKEGFPEVVTHIEELEKQGHVLVTRAAKDNQPKHVFWNEITLEQGGKVVDEGSYSFFQRCAASLIAVMLNVMLHQQITHNLLLVQSSGSYGTPLIIL